MKIPKLFQQEQSKPSNRIAMQGGSYSLILTAVVLAIVIVCNVLVSALPTSLTSFDISAAQLYAVLSNLTQDVTIYWIVQADEEDAVIENLLGEYESLSDHIIVEKKNPDAYPTFAQQYTEEEVKNNSLVVECGERNRYISYDDIYLSEPDLYSYAYSTHKDDTWVYDADEAFPVDEEQMNELLDQFSSLGAAFRMESVEDLGQYGLDDPICTIELTAGETEYTITLGDYSVMDE